MYRILTSVTVSVLIICTLSHEVSSQGVVPDLDIGLRPGGDVAVLGVRPPVLLPRDGQTRFSLLSSVGEPGDTLSAAQLAHRISSIYRYQAAFLTAEAQGDTLRTEEYLDRAVRDLRRLARVPGVMDEIRYRELYRTIVTEYETYYGRSDTLMTEFGDIFELRAEMFAELERVEEPLLEDVVLPELGPMQTEFPMEVNRLVQQSIQFLQRNPQRHVYNWLARSETYFPMIEQILREEGVPDELKYLALIESGLNPRARSWAGAGGMWQFMPATGRMYGLHVNHWVDERNDPEKATRAAARHLRDLYERFEDWKLVLAAYNWGPGGVQRAIRRTQASDGQKVTYWDIYDIMPRETRNYVPAYIAAAIVSSNPEAFNLNPTQKGPRYEYDFVPVPGLMNLNTVAQLAGTDVATIRALNPELRQSTTPPTEEPYMIRIPFGSYQQFARNLSQLPREEFRVNSHYQVRRGDNLGRIANQFGTTVGAIQRANNLRGTMIHPGQSLIVPLPEYNSGFAEELASSSALQVQYARHIRRPIEVAALSELTTASASESTPAVSSPSTVPDRSAVRTVSTSPSAQPDETQPAQPERIVYQVRRGDTLGAIARRHGVTVNNLRQWNNIRGSRINVGQRLHIHVSASVASDASSPEATPQYHTVRRGDTLSTIARRYGVSINQLRAWNGINGSRINAGQRLRVSG